MFKVIKDTFIYLWSFIRPVDLGMSNTCETTTVHMTHDDLMSIVEEEIRKVLVSRTGRVSVNINLKEGHIPSVLSDDTMPCTIYAKLRENLGPIEVLSISVPPKSDNITVTLFLTGTRTIVKISNKLFKELFELSDR